MLHKEIRRALKVPDEINDNDFLSIWKKRTSKICKPCWELRYCPYGPMVEEFPLLPQTRESAIEHNDYLCVSYLSGFTGNGEVLDGERRLFFESQIQDFEEKDYPEEIPEVLKDASCKVFGHLCPVFFVAEDLTETKDRRAHTRNISRSVMLKVVRRDGQICQICNDPVPDNEVHFDHVIPYSKGGPSTVENLRIVHNGCNWNKGKKLEGMLSQNPIDQIFSKKKVKKKT
ncbi:MAG: HNH endonuclease [Bacteriovoracaceae bacterium]|nr:HNH endonuclease [Bacteriovoracaceae bacterium]